MGKRSEILTHLLTTRVVSSLTGVQRIRLCPDLVLSSNIKGRSNIRAIQSTV